MIDEVELLLWGCAVHMNYKHYSYCIPNEQTSVCFKFHCDILDLQQERLHQMNINDKVSYAYSNNHY